MLCLLVCKEILFNKDQTDDHKMYGIIVHKIFAGTTPQVIDREK
jgi:hypothetical protein